MIKFNSLAIALLLLGGIDIATADPFQPSHSCTKPYKPYSFSSKYDLDNYLAEVDRYKRCIADFVDEQREQANNHLNAAKDAIDEWNRFVRFELN